MVPATQQQLQKQPTDATTVTTAEEEALRRNTDCVYFLASPLTCKKGSDCEYRHSEYARGNPRDCYFWLSGNCLNPKCGFRHPPLDGLLGGQGGASAGPTTHSSHAAPASSALSAPHVPYKMGKQAVACVFFQSGGCMKGDQCAFLHVTKPMPNKTQQPLEATPVPKSQSLKVPFGGLERCTQGKVVSSASANDSKAGAHLEMRRTPEVKNAPGSVRSFEKKVPLYENSKQVNQQNMTNVLPVAGGIAGRHSSQLHQGHAFEDDHSFQNGKDGDDYLRESSPGFDVLVEDGLRGSDYYHGEDQYGRREREEKNPLDEYDVDFNSNADRELFSESQGYETYGGRQESLYGWGQQHRASNERKSERKPFLKDESLDNIEESDLRYRLSKHRRVGNGLRSVVNQDHHRHNYSSERTYNSSHRDVRQETYSSRLQGRIKLPGRGNGNDSGSERDIVKETYRGRLSPDKRQHTYPGRLRDRITGRIEDNNIEDRNIGALRKRREMSDETNREFVAPKRLAELKGGRDERTSEPLDRKRKSLVEDHQKQSEADASFDAPLPFSEILKRKRGSSVHKEESPQETKEIDPVSVPNNETGIEEKPETALDQLSEQTKTVEAANGEEVMVDEEGNEYEGEGEYYEEGYEEEGEYYEEGEHVEGEEEYVEEEYVEEEKDRNDGNDAMLS